MDISLWLAFVAATTALLLIPGPTVLLVLSYAIGHGRQVAVSTALVGAFAFRKRGAEPAPKRQARVRVRMGAPGLVVRW